MKLWVSSFDYEKDLAYIEANEGLFAVKTDGFEYVAPPGTTLQEIFFATAKKECNVNYYDFEICVDKSDSPYVWVVRFYCDSGEYASQSVYLDRYGQIQLCVWEKR